MNITKILSTSLFFALITTSAYAMDAREIMQKIIDRDDGQTEMSIQRYTTCKYAKKGEKIACVDRPRVKEMESVRKDFGPNQRDHKGITIILNPAGERGIGMLQYDYEAEEKDTDQWMYFSALGKVKRLVSGSSNEPKKGSLFGTEFGPEDVEAPKLNDYNYKILKETTYKKRPVWIIESTPTKEKFKKSNYSKHIMWVDKERLTMMRGDLYNRQGKLTKRMTARKFQKINDIWVARSSMMNNLETSRITNIKLLKVTYNVPIDDNFLTLRTLTDRAFRESHLEKLRVLLQ